MVSSSGARLLAVDAERSIVTDLLPLAALVTPNLDEASILVGQPVTNPDQMRAAALRLVELGAQAVLLKGGHLTGDELVDLLFDGSKWGEWKRPRIHTTSTHGTGCTLSAAIAAGLAKGLALYEAVDNALTYVARAIETAPRLGSGHGPLNHMIEES